VRRSWLIEGAGDLARAISDVVEAVGSEQAGLIAEWAKRSGLDEVTKPFTLHVTHEEGVGINFHVEW
jgi:hypothetical protein